MQKKLYVGVGAIRGFGEWKTKVPKFSLITPIFRLSLKLPYTYVYSCLYEMYLRTETAPGFWCRRKINNNLPNVQSRYDFRSIDTFTKKIGARKSIKIVSTGPKRKKK